MLDLIEKLNAAEGPDRILSAAIWLDVVAPHVRTEWNNIFALPPENHYSRICPRYTESVDAAMTLLPDGVEVIDLKLSWDTTAQPGHPACSVRWYESGEKGNDWKACSVSAKTLPLTMCLAALTLRSRASFAKSNSGPLTPSPPSVAVGLMKPGADVGGVSAAAPGDTLEANR